MKRLSLTAALVLGLLAASCSVPMLPEPLRPASQHQPSVDARLAELRACWQLLEAPQTPAARRAELTERYNALLLELIREYRYAYREEAHLHSFREFDVDFASSRLNLESADRVYDDFIPAADVECTHLEEHYRVPGLGVPLVGIIPAEKTANVPQAFTFRSRGTVSSLTAVLEFPKAGRPCLHLLPRARQERFHGHPLAADFSASLELYGRMTGLKDGRFLGLLRPSELEQRDVKGLVCLESYDPDKIPVILVHGLMSSAATFDNLINRLMDDPDIRRRYQFWLYNYPTGVAWTITAASYRAALEDARNTLDPHHRNRNWDRKVLIGHSMGGLITHYSQCTEPWNLLRNSGSLRSEKLAPYLDARYVNAPFEDAKLEPFRKQFFFRPVPAGMVIYLATPHRGAPLARYRITRALTHLIELPQNLVSEALNVATLSDDLFIFEPSRLTDWFTSVSQLSPGSYSIRGLQGLTIRGVPTHSVIGNQGEEGPRSASSDGVVPYWSSHFSWGGETMVPASHSVQDAAETAACLRKLLREYDK
ncbi:MAG: hypothetical protein MJ051_07415 [Akkermansia sp.]|nr:hypothetical protein [Akkermansia sp.]